MKETARRPAAADQADTHTAEAERHAGAKGRADRTTLVETVSAALRTAVAALGDSDLLTGTLPFFAAGFFATAFVFFAAGFFAAGFFALVAFFLEALLVLDARVLVLVVLVVLRLLVFALAFATLSPRSALLVEAPALPAVLRSGSPRGWPLTQLLWT